MSILRKFKKRYLNFTLKNISLFLFIWLLTGFSMGTSTLLGPVRWIVNFGKSLQFSQNTESLLIKLVILLFVLASFYVSLLITKMMLKKDSLILNISTVSLLIALTTGFTWLWMNPSMMQMGSRELTEESVGDIQFVFGPYPTEEEFRKLKDDGYTGIVSLLHPAVVPFEPKLLSDEKETAKRFELQLIHVPMLPWISDNKTSIEKIKDLAQNGNGKYYVHCYLGKDRVNVVKRIIQNYTSSTVSVNINAQRKLTELESFERGEIIELDKGVYLTPFPTDDEYFGFVLNGWIKKVVSLLNPKHPPDTMWINKEEQIVKLNLMPYELLPIEMPINDMKVSEIVNKVKQMPRPLLIHAFLSKSPQTDAFIQAFNSSSSSLVSSAFNSAMKRGKVEIYSPNIVFGPNPTKEEFQDYLYDNGVNNIYYIGNERLASAIYDKLAAQDVGLKWYSSEEITPDVIATLKSGGPWFVYGLENDEMIVLLKSGGEKENLLIVVD